jgi:hypothetical protein
MKRYLALVVLALSTFALAQDDAAKAERIEALKPLLTVPTTEKIDGLDQYTTYKPISEENKQKAEELARLFLEEFSKYPTEFVKASKLKTVAIVQDLAVGGQRRAAVPLAHSEMLMYDVNYLYNRLYMRYVVHHEYYHMLEEQWNGSFYFKDPKWAAFNETDFKYGPGGAEAYNKGGDLVSPTFPRKGFITGYSLYGLEEDKADTWANLFIPEYWRRIEPVLATDEIIRAKVDYLKAFAKSKCPAMDDTYWKSLIPPLTSEGEGTGVRVQESKVLSTSTPIGVAYM